MDQQQNSTTEVGRVNPLFQPIDWQGQRYYTTRYFHQEYLLHMADSGRKVTHKRFDNFQRMVRTMPIYYLLLEQGDIIELQWHEALTSSLRGVFRVVQYRPLTLLNATAQIELTHHLDDDASRALAYGHNKAVTTPKALDAYPELKAIVELVESVAAARKVAEAAQLQAHDATAKADLALQQQQWLTIREYVYLNKLTHQFPETLWATFGRYLTGYCIEHGIPIRRQPIAGKAYDMEQSYHVEVMEQLLPPWLTRKQGQASLYQIKPQGATS